MKIYLLFLMFFLAACSTSQIRQEIEQDKVELAEEMTHRDQMMSKSYGLIESSDQITESQKEAFHQIKVGVYQQVQEINLEIALNKILLFRTLVDEEAHAERIRILTHDLRKLHDKKLDIMIDAFFDLKETLGAELIEPMLHERFHEHWFEDYAGTRGGL